MLKAGILNGLLVTKNYRMQTWSIFQIKAMLSLLRASKWLTQMSNSKIITKMQAKDVSAPMYLMLRLAARTRQSTWSTGPTQSWRNYKNKLLQPISTCKKCAKSNSLRRTKYLTLTKSVSAASMMIKSVKVCLKKTTLGANSWIQTKWELTTTYSMHWTRKQANSWKTPTYFQMITKWWWRSLLKIWGSRMQQNPTQLYN